MPPRSCMRAAFLGALIGMAGTTALAHHPGGVGNTGEAGPINTIAASTLEQGRIVAGITLDYVHLNSLSDATLSSAAASGIEGVHGLRAVQVYSLSAAYGVTNDLTLSFRLPYVRREGIRAGELDAGTGDVEVLDHGSASGIGDVTVLGQHRFLNASRSEAALLLGFKAPTGATDRLSRQGELLDAEFQPGSGAWNGLFGLAATQRIGVWSLNANVLYARATEGTQHTNLGDQLSYNAAVSYRLRGLADVDSFPMFHGAHAHSPGDDGHGHVREVTGPAVDLVLELNGEWHAKQTAFGVKDDNSGGNTIYVSPGLRLSIDKFSSFVSLSIPVASTFNGTQPEPDWRLTSGIMVAF